MNRLLWTTLVFSVSVSTVFSEPLKVQIETRDKKFYSGLLSNRSAGSVDFQPIGAAAPVQIPDAQINQMKFSVPDSQEEEIAQLFANGQYDQVLQKSTAVLSPFLPYSNIPSNLTPAYLRWMIACFWAGDFDQAEKLSKSLAQLPGDELSPALRFYNKLIGLEKGDFQTMQTFLQTPEAEALYPESSAARLYIKARLLQNKKEYNSALRTAALLIALHSTDADWMPMTELLCAKLYAQLNMPESAESVLADINEFYSEPQVKKRAAALAAAMNGEKR